MIMDHVRLGKLVPFAIVALVSVNAVVLAVSDSMSIKHLGRSMEMSQEQQRYARLAREIAVVQQDIVTDIVRTQESLTDMSATRGLDGLDDGISNAVKSAADLHAGLTKLSALAVEANLPTLPPLLEKLGAQFDRFHAAGVEMAQAYVKDGPAGGNKLMVPFDAVSEDLQKGIDATHAIVAAHMADVDQRGEQQNADLQQEAGAMFRLMSGLGILIILSGIALAIFISRRLMKPLGKARIAMNELATGRTDVALDYDNRADEIGDLARAYRNFRENLIARQRAEMEQAELRSAAHASRQQTEAERNAELERTQVVVDNLAEALSVLASGDLSVRIHHRFAGEYDRLRLNFNESAERLQQAMQGIISIAGEIQSDSSGVRTSANQLSSRTEQQAAALEETAAALQQITETVANTAKRAEDAGQKVNAATGQAHASGTVVQQTIHAMVNIEQSSQQIGQIIGVIDEIAFQTNLLALNAGVEAARAGSAGKGFAVVAQEVRELAQRSAKAAKEIKELIGRSGAAVGSGVTLVNEMGGILSVVQKQVNDIHQDISAIIVAAQEQATGLREINGAVGQMDQVTQQNAAMVVETSHALQRLAHGAEDLYGQVMQFRVSDGGMGKGARAA